MRIRQIDKEELRDFIENDLLKSAEYKYATLKEATIDSVARNIHTIVNKAILVEVAKKHIRKELEDQYPNPRDKNEAADKLIDQALQLMIVNENEEIHYQLKEQNEKLERIAKRLESN